MSEEKHKDIDHTCFEHLMKPNSRPGGGSRWEGYSAMQHITSGMAGVQHRNDTRKAAWKAARKAKIEVPITDGDKKKTEEAK